jgi:hypothetical protein
MMMFSVVNFSTSWSSTTRLPEKIRIRRRPWTYSSAVAVREYSALELPHPLLSFHPHVLMANLALYLFQILLLPDVFSYIVEMLCFLYVRYAPTSTASIAGSASSTGSLLPLTSWRRY